MKIKIQNPDYEEGNNEPREITIVSTENIEDSEKVISQHGYDAKSVNWSKELNELESLRQQVEELTSEAE